MGPIERKARHLTGQFARHGLRLPKPVARGFNRLAWASPSSYPFKSLVRGLDRRFG